MQTMFAILLLTIGLVFSGLPATQAADKKPNILIIWGDDIGQFNLSAYNRGLMGYRTPNIDRLATQGARPLSQGSLPSEQVSRRSVCPVPPRA